MNTKTPFHISPMIIMVGLLLGYVFLFMAHAQHASLTPANISPALPTGVLKALGHSYLKQVIAEALFIKTAVYYGGLNQRMDTANLHIMAQHFMAMSQLHPKLMDIYYRSESVLAHRGDTHTRTVNLILENGRRALPKQVTLPFFEGFNYFHYLNEPIKAAKILRSASSIADAPQWIGHLASMLMASAGNIRTGLIWLKGMSAAAQNPDEKLRYDKEIIVFEKAMQVQLALNQYVQRMGAWPDHLNALLVHDLSALPTFQEGFQLDYQPPQLRLRRQPKP